MTRDEFVKAVCQNAMTVTGYKIGCDGRGKDHLCDCIGLIKGAFAILGISWQGGPGTNWAARHFINGLTEFASVLELKKGDVVLKRHKPGENGYNLPESYKGDPDQNDYYHIGVVVSEYPFKIVHCTSVPGGIQYDQSKRNWTLKGVLKPIKDQGGDTPVEQAIVTADNPYPVKLRAQPSQNATVLLKVNQGEIVDVLDEGPEWSKVKYQEITGYMMTKFTVPVGTTEPLPPGEDESGYPPVELPQAPEEGVVTLKIPESTALALLPALIDFVEILEGVLGKG